MISPRWLLLSAGLAGCLLGCGQQTRWTEQTRWPARPVTLICPWSAGGGTDRVARQLAAQLKDELNVPVNVVNATGGGGAIGHSRGALARPDGYTLTMATVELNMLHWRGICPITPDDFRPLAKLNQDSAAVFVRRDSAWQTLSDLRAAVDEAATPVRASGTANGGIWHIAWVGGLQAAGLPADATTWVSMSGAAPSLQELMAGGIDVVCCSLPEAGTLLQAGEIRCLGVMSEQRSPAAADVPTFSEQGIDWSMGGWRGLVYPHGVPEERVARMEQAVLKIASGERFASFMNTSGFQRDVVDGRQFAAFLDRTDSDFGEILEQPAMKQQAQPPIGAYWMPAACGVLLVAVAGFGSITSRSGSEVEPAQPTGTDVTLLFGFLASLLGFLILYEPLGYVLACGLLLAILLALLKVRWTVTLPLVCVLVPTIYQVFSGLLGVPLPWGVLGW